MINDGEFPIKDKLKLRGNIASPYIQVERQRNRSSMVRRVPQLDVQVGPSVPHGRLCITTLDASITDFDGTRGNCGPQLGMPHWKI